MVYTGIFTFFFFYINKIRTYAQVLRPSFYRGIYRKIPTRPYPCRCRVPRECRLQDVTLGYNDRIVCASCKRTIKSLQIRRNQTIIREKKNRRDNTNAIVKFFY